MRWLLGILLFFAMTLNGPSVCQHAFAADAPPEKHIMHDMGPADHSHHDISITNSDAPMDHSSHCPGDCDGGLDCEGCSLAISIVHDVAPAQHYMPPLGRPVGLFAPLLPTQVSPDTPPPKRLFFA